MITRKPWIQHLLAMAVLTVAMFGYTCWYNSYLLGHSKSAYLSYYARVWDQGLSAFRIWRIGYSSVLYIAVIIGLYELVLLALKGRFKGED